MAREYTFKKKERLSNKRQIERLFNTGYTFLIHPFKIFLTVDDNPQSTPVKVLIAVSKRKFKKAADRNRIRRKIKEAYRLKKSILYDEVTGFTSCINLGIVYIGDDLNPDYYFIENKLVQCLVRLKGTISN
ncbi:MAG: ribonuclease P protein component [Bacteroidales bacterium]|nr:ribonuclease P protein component [Bacteroidales bacterium]